MNINLDFGLAETYKSPCQRARVVTEGWVAKFMYCPACPAHTLAQARDNTRAVDFYCADCGTEYQVKARSTPLGGKVRDAAFQPLMNRVLADRGPNFAFMHYDISSATVRNFLLVPKHFITPGVIERCAPLSARARRAGWVGCNILTGLLPVDARIFVVRDGLCLPVDQVRTQWKRFAWLAERKVEARGWLADVLRCVRLLGDGFKLDDVYRFEAELSKAHPNNRYVRAKIRQQLQILRDKGVLRFLGGGRYQAMDVSR